VVTQKEREEYLRKIIDNLSPAQAQEALKTVQLLDKKSKEGGSFHNFIANPAQVPIINSNKRIVATRGGNRSSKTHAIAYVDAMHATGLYPDAIKYWRCREDCQYFMKHGKFRVGGDPIEVPYTGTRFYEAPKMGIISVSQDQMVKGIQSKLFGPSHDFGTGLIPKDLILDHQFIKETGCLNWALIKHSSGGTVKLDCMNYTQNVSQYMGFDWQYAHFDEQPKWDIFDESRMRMLDKGGYMHLTFHPREDTELTTFLDKLEEKKPEYYDSFYLEWQDNYTLNDDMIQMCEETMTEEEKLWRKYGRRNNSEGRVFPWDKEIYVIEPFVLEPYWRRIAGFDVGHSTAAVSGAYDDQANILYIYNEYEHDGALPAVHASALRQWGDIDLWIDPASRQVKPTDLQSLYQIYEREGLRIKKAETYAGSVMTSINILNQMYEERRVCIFSTCTSLIKQIGLYRRRKNGTTGMIEIVKKDDHLVDCMRYLTLHLDQARVMGATKKKIQPEIIQWKPADPRVGF
jgi:hypothetical protein